MPERDDPHKRAADDEDLSIPDGERHGEYDLMEEELDLGDDYISSALAALENYSGDSQDQESSEDAALPLSGELTDHLMAAGESSQKRVDELENRVEELEQVLSANEKKSRKKLDEQGQALKESRRLILKMRDEYEDMKQSVEKANLETEEYKRKWQETVASYVNYQKQTKKKLAEFVEIEKANMLRRFLPVIDDMQRPLAYEEVSDSLLNGIRLVIKQFQDFLEALDVKAIPALGEKFDPYFHEAVSRIPREDVSSNTVIEELQAGYLMGDKVLRPSKVSVSYSNRTPESSPSVTNEALQVSDDDVPVRMEHEKNNESRTEISQSLIKDSNLELNSLESD